MRSSETRLPSDKKTESQIGEGVGCELNETQSMGSVWVAREMEQSKGGAGWGGGVDGGVGGSQWAERVRG